MSKNKSIFPSVLTTLNLLLGFLAIIKVTSGDFTGAGWLIIIAAIADGLDGKVARMLKQGSRFGVEYDSLADMVSFGAAPAILVYTIYFKQFGVWGALITSAFVLCGAFRLARYNATSKPNVKSYYCGLPIPIAAITMVSFYHFNIYYGMEPILFPLYFPLILILSFLMLSHIRYDPMPRLTFREDIGNKLRLLFLIVSLILIAVWPQTVFLPLCLIYIFHGIVRSIIRLIKSLTLKQESLETLS